MDCWWCWFCGVLSIEIVKYGFLPPTVETVGYDKYRKNWNCKMSEQMLLPYLLFLIYYFILPLPRLKPWAMLNIVRIEIVKCWNKCYFQIGFRRPNWKWFQRQTPNPKQKTTNIFSVKISQMEYDFNTKRQNPNKNLITKWSPDWNEQLV